MLVYIQTLKKKFTTMPGPESDPGSAAPTPPEAEAAAQAQAEAAAAAESERMAVEANPQLSPEYLARLTQPGASEGLALGGLNYALHGGNTKSKPNDTVHESDVVDESESVSSDDEVVDAVIVDIGGDTEKKSSESAPIIELPDNNSERELITAQDLDAESGPDLSVLEPTPQSTDESTTSRASRNSQQSQFNPEESLDVGIEGLPLSAYQEKVKGRPNISRGIEDVIKNYVDNVKMGTIKEIPPTVLVTEGEKMIKIITSDRVQAFPHQLKVSSEGLLLVADWLENNTDIPDAKQLMAIRKFVNAQNLEDHAEGNIIIQTILEKSDPKNWLLSDEEKVWLQRVSETPKLNVPMVHAEKRAKDAQAKQDEIDQLHLNPEDRTVPDRPTKMMDPHRIFKPWFKQKGELPQPTKLKVNTDPARSLSGEEVQRLKAEFFDNNPRIRVHPSAHIQDPTGKGILAIAKKEALDRLDLDKDIRKLMAEEGTQTLIRVEYAMSHATQEKADRANALADISNRTDAQQLEMKTLQAAVKEYNDGLKKPLRRARTSFIFADVHAIQLQAEATKSNGVK